MPKFIIEREIPDAGNLSAEKLKAISQKSRDVLCTMGTDIQWIHSYVAGNKIYCIYIAANEQLILEHARKGGFPANCVTKISAIIEPATAE
jgi:predicted Rdx family selenoprotein